MNELVSIVIPFYNGSKFLKDLLESIRVQSYANIEVIIINDGSNVEETAKLQEISSGFSQLKIRHAHQNNSGISAARNHGINLASGNFITFIDQDDFLASRYSIDFRINHLKTKPTLDGVIGFNIKVNSLGQVQFHKLSATTESLITSVIESPNTLAVRYLEYYLAKQKIFFFTTGGGMFRANSIKEFLFNSRFDKIEDIEWTARLLGAGKKIELVKVPVYCKRKHENQSSSNTPGNLENDIKAVMKDLLENLAN